MTAINKVETQITETLAAATRALDAASSAGYEAFGRNVHLLEGAAREAFQARLETHLWPVLEKLEEGEALTSAEHDMLRMMIVGEAKYYVKSENDVENWQRELERLLQEIGQLQAGGLDDIDALMKVRALCREALRILPDLAYYFREQERIRKFEEATAGALDRDTRRILANLVREMLLSDKI